MARRLANGLGELGVVEIPYAIQANAVFAVFPQDIESRLGDADAAYLAWVVYPADRWDGRLRRLVTSFATTEAEVDRFMNVCARAFA